MNRTWSRWPDWANAIAGIWLFVSPWVLGVATAEAWWNFWLTGIAIFLVSMWVLGAPWAVVGEWVNLVLAVWLFISPWVLRYTTDRANWNAWIVGVIVFFLSVWALSMVRAQPPLEGGPPSGGPRRWAGPRSRYLQR